MSVDEIRKAFAPVLSGVIAAVYPTIGMAGLTTESGIPQAFDWLSLAIEISREQEKKGKQVPLPPIEEHKEIKEEKLPHQTSVRTPGNLAPKLDSWLARLQDDPLSPEEFLQKFNDVALPDWDHYTHIRLAYLILKLHGRQRGKPCFSLGMQLMLTRALQERTCCSRVLQDIYLKAKDHRRRESHSTSL